MTSIKTIEQSSYRSSNDDRSSPCAACSNGFDSVVQREREEQRTNFHMFE